MADNNKIKRYKFALIPLVRFKKRGECGKMKTIITITRIYVENTIGRRVEFNT